jgi:inosose dehydratase
MANIMIGNAPCSWGTLEFEGIGKNEVTATQMLDELAATGYTATELGDWGFLPTEPAVLADELARRNLAITGAFVPVALRYPQTHDAGEAAAVRAARLLADAARRTGQGAQPFLVLADENGTDPVRTQFAGRVTYALGMSNAERQMFSIGVNRVAEAVHKATGLRTVFHHHCAGMVETPDEIELMLSITDPALVGLVFDTGHYAFGAGGCQTMLEALDRFADRIWYMHFKDCDPMVLMKSQAAGWDYFTSLRNGIFCELGQGCVDFAAVKAWLERRAYSGYITVEQDLLPGMGTPRASAQRNREYLRGIGL